MLMVGSLFAGIGGLDLGLERAGMQVKWQVENNPYCIRVLAKHWPSVKRYGDIKQIKWSEVEPVDLICGGFPCQPVSVAGARKGDKDERWLWLEFLRAIREVRPRYALVENVPGLLSTDDGRLARGVFGDLAEIGYDAEWNIVSAADVGAPHLRKRIFIVAHAQSDLRSAPRNERPFALDWGSSSLENPRCLVGQEGAEVEGILSRFSEEWNSRIESAGPSNMADSKQRGLSQRGSKPQVSVISRIGEHGQETIVAHSQSFDGSRPEQEGVGTRKPEVSTGDRCTALGDSESIRFTRMGQAEDEWQVNRGLNAPDNSSEIGRECSQWAVEPDVGRVADGVPSRVDRLKCLGNAVVPQVAEYVGRLIMEVAER